MKDEFEFIESITPRQTDQASLVKGIGDDAAVYRGSDEYDEVICVDTMVEGVHFRRDTLTPFQIGKKALAINVSDLAAMGAQPIYYIVSVAASADWKQEELEDVYKGMFDLAQEYKMDLIGGDTVSTPDTLVLTVTVIGRVERNRAVYRHTAKPGDVVFITGYAGRSAAGLDLLFEKGVNGSFSLEEQKLVKAHQEPQPHVKAGRILCQTGVRVSLNDVSDGVASEANELAEASNVRIHIDARHIPIDEAMSSYSREQQLEYVFFGGEDFVLIGTVKEEDFSKVEEFFKEEGLFITKIGHVLSGEGVYLKEENQLTRLEKKGYNHFQKAWVKFNMETWSIRTMAPEETMVFAEKLGALVQQGDVITLEGDLGAGKTSFTKGLAKGLGVKKVVNSPTFTIMKQYKGRIPLYHMDVYRLENEYEDLGFEEYFYGDGVTVIEWPSMIVAQLPQDRLKITIEYKGESERLIMIEATGSRSSELSKELAV